MNVIGSILYLIGAAVFKTNKTSTNDLSNINNIPAFVFNIVGMLAFLAESILCFFMPRVSKISSKCSVEFFAHLFNLLGNITYLAANIIQPILSLIASFTTEFLNKITDMIFIIIRPIETGGDIIYVIDAVLYIIVWIKANEQMRKVGIAWIEQGHATINEIAKKQKWNVTTSKQLPEVIVTNRQFISKNQLVKIMPKQIRDPIEPSSENLLDVETIMWDFFVL